MRPTMGSRADASRIAMNSRMSTPPAAMASAISPTTIATPMARPIPRTVQGVRSCRIVGLRYRGRGDGGCRWLGWLWRLPGLAVLLVALVAAVVVVRLRPVARPGDRTAPRRLIPEVGGPRVVLARPARPAAGATHPVGDVRVPARGP